MQRCTVARFSWVVGLLACWSISGLAVAQPAASSSSAVAKEKALETFREGIAAFDRRDFEAARVAFLQTFALRPSEPVVRRNLGLAEIYSGHYLDGARRLSRVLHTTHEGDAQARTRMLESLEIAEAHLERITVEVDVDGADIVIDGVNLGESPLAFAWYVEPGRYDVRIERAGYEVHEQQRAARAGAHRHLRVNLVALTEPAEEETMPLSTPSRHDVTAPSLSGGWVAAGATLTVAGVVTGIVFASYATDNEEKASRLRAEIGDVACSPPTLLPQACGRLRSAALQHDRQERWALVSFGVAGVAALSTLTYALVVLNADPDPDMASGGLRWSAGAGPGGVRVALGGAF